jgi:hypothetical protein
MCVCMCGCVECVCVCVGGWYLETVRGETDGAGRFHVLEQAMRRGQKDVAVEEVRVQGVHAQL